MDIECVTVDYKNIDFTDSEKSVVDWIIWNYNISENCIIIAVSFGGLLAARIKNVIPNIRLVLIGSMTNLNEIGKLNEIALRTKVFKYFNVTLMPKVLMCYYFGIKTNEAWSVFISMLSAYPHKKICDMIEFMLKLKPVSIVWNARVHGDNDRLIKLPDRPHILVKGGHILTIKNNNNEDILHFIASKIA